MKKTLKVVSLLLLFAMLLIGVRVNAATSTTMTITAGVSDGSQVTLGANIAMNAWANSGPYIKSIEYKLYNTTNGANTLIKTDSRSTSVPSVGSTAVGIQVPVSETYASFKVVVTGTDMSNNTKEATFNYTMTNGGSTQNKMTITSSIASGSQVAVGTDIILNVLYNNGAYVKSIEYKLYNTTSGANTLIKTDSKTSSTPSVGSTGIGITASITSVYTSFKIVATATDMNNETKSETFNYTMTSGGSTQNKMTITSGITSGSVVTVGTNIAMNAWANDGAYVKSIEYKLYNTTSGANTLIKTDSKTSSTPSVGSTAVGIQVPVTETYSSFKVVVTGTNMNNETKSETFNYTMTGSNNIIPTITVNPSSGTIDGNSNITVTVGNATYFVRLIYKWDDGAEQYSAGTITNITVPNTAGTHKLSVCLEYTSNNSTVRTAWTHYYYTVVEDEYGPINKELDGLAIDLITEEKTNFYSVDEDIDMRAYYYNADKKSKSNVKIEIEIPDGFKVVNRGTGTLSRGVLTFNIGTVASEQLGSVAFTIVSDDDNSEEIVNVIATIYEKNSEEDSSTIRLFIYDAGEKGVHNSYITGYPDGTFRPDGYITREEVAAMLARAFGFRGYATTSRFSDITTSRWSFNYITACSTNGIITGYPDGTFKPNGNITKAELYAMTYRAMQIDASEKALFVPSKYNKNYSWERDYIAGLDRMNMLKGMPSTDASAYATRAEVVFLINRVLMRNPASTSNTIFPDVYGHWAINDIAEAATTHNYKRLSSGKESIY